jgi:hypothetical protein
MHDVTRRHTVGTHEMVEGQQYDINRFYNILRHMKTRVSKYTWHVNNQRVLRIPLQCCSEIQGETHAQCMLSVSAKRDMEQVLGNEQFRETYPT